MDLNSLNSIYLSHIKGAERKLPVDQRPAFLQRVGELLDPHTKGGGQVYDAAVHRAIASALAQFPDRAA